MIRGAAVLALVVSACGAPQQVLEIAAAKVPAAVWLIVEDADGDTLARVQCAGTLADMQCTTSTNLGVTVSSGVKFSIPLLGELSVRISAHADEGGGRLELVPRVPLVALPPLLLPSDG